MNYKSTNFAIINVQLTTLYCKDYPFRALLHSHTRRGRVWPQIICVWPWISMAAARCSVARKIARITCVERATSCFWAWDGDHGLHWHMSVTSWTVPPCQTMHQYDSCTLSNTDLICACELPRLEWLYIYIFIFIFYLIEHAPLSSVILHAMAHSGLFCL